MKTRRILATTALAVIGLTGTVGPLTTAAPAQAASKGVLHGSSITLENWTGADLDVTTLVGQNLSYDGGTKTLSDCSAATDAKPCSTRTANNPWGQDTDVRLSFTYPNGDGETVQGYSCLLFCMLDGGPGRFGVQSGPTGFRPQGGQNGANALSPLFCNASSLKVGQSKTCDLPRDIGAAWPGKRNAKDHSVRVTRNADLPKGTDGLNTRLYSYTVAVLT